MTHAPRLLRASGDDDPALAETSWPLLPGYYHDIEWRMRYGEPSRTDMLCAAEVIAAYKALTCDGTTTQQTKRLAALRRIWRRRSR